MFFSNEKKEFSRRNSHPLLIKFLKSRFLFFSKNRTEKRETKEISNITVYIYRNQYLNSLCVGLWSGKIADSCECQSRPVERSEIFAGQRCEITFRIRIRPIRLKAFRLGQQIVKAAKPVGQHKQDVHQINDPPSIWIHNSRFHPIQCVSFIQKKNKKKQTFIFLNKILSFTSRK